MSTPPPLRLSEKVGYGLGDMASNFFFQSFNIFLLFYYTDVFGIPAGFVGTLFLVSRLWDAVNDPLMGMVADRTSTRWGKYRPYLLWFAAPYGILGFLMFANPDLGLTGRMVYAAVTYTAMMMVYTAINIPYGALLAVISPSSVQRTTLSTFRFVGAFGGGMMVTAMVLPLKDFLGGGDEAMGFRATMAIFGVLSVVLFLTTFLLTRERVRPIAEGNPPLASDLKDLMGNRPWQVLVAAALFTLANVAVRNGSIIYYFKYNLRDEAQFSAFATAGMGAMLAGVACTRWFAARWDKRSLMIWLSLANAASIGALFFVPAGNLPLLYAINIAGTFLVGPTPALVWAMYSDVADYSEWKTGRRATALIFSSAQFAQKMGLTLGGAFSAWMLVLFGFVPNVEQDDGALLGIRLLFAIFPAILATFGALAIFFYPLTDRRVLAIEEELIARRLAAGAHPDPRSP